MQESKGLFFFAGGKFNTSVSCVCTDSHRSQSALFYDAFEFYWISYKEPMLLKFVIFLMQFWINKENRCHFLTSRAETQSVTHRKEHEPPQLSSLSARDTSVKFKTSSCRAALWCWQLDTNLLPVWIQNGILPSVWDRWGPLKLYLYSNRRWGGSSDVEAPAAISATLQWNNNVVRKVNINPRALAAGSCAMDTAMFRYHCWRSAEATRMTGCL